MSKNEIGQDSSIPEFIYPKIQRRDGVESLTILEEGEFKVPIDGCIKYGYMYDAPRPMSTFSVFFTTSWPWCLFVTLPNGLSAPNFQNLKFEACCQCFCQWVAEYDNLDN